MSDADARRAMDTHSRPVKETGGSTAAAADGSLDKAKPNAGSEGEEGKGKNGFSNADAREDSEAETVVLSGKDDASPSHQRRVIKHEGNGHTTPTATETEAEPRDAKRFSASNVDGSDKKMLKDLTATSSNLSSAKSSPAPDTAPSPAGSDSGFAKQDSKEGSEPPFMGLLSRKRKNTSDDHEEKGHKRRQRRDVSMESTANTTASDRDRRERREGSSNLRSESPQPRTRTRGHSIKSNQAPLQQQGLQKRKKPPPLQVERRTRNPVDLEDASEDSDRKSSQKLRRPPATDTIAMSPAKPPHRKLKDKSGRTFLARACDSEDVDAVKARLLERPEDLNVEDHAGNTPLQIAALAGSDDIVKVLLDAGCDIQCRNVDKDTPLIDAVENGHLEVIKLLINAGMDPCQSNARGEELLDLLDSDLDNFKDIKRVLEKAKDERKKTSDDHPRASAPARSPRESVNPSPPPSITSGSRRRAARREPTRNDLLYVNPTPENLRERAKIGDDEAVDHILSMRPIADLPAVLAASRGGHEMSLTLLIAIGKPEQDPDPLPGEKLSQSTPMLAAIGRGSLRVIELLLKQSGFNPTRRLYKGLTYPEISKERRGANWESEYKLLKRAYDDYKARNINGSSPSGKQDSQSLKKSRTDPTSSSSVTLKRSSPESTKDGFTRKHSGLEVKRTIERREKDRGGDRSSEASKKHLRVPMKAVSREQSTAISDREASPLSVTKEKSTKHKRSMSEAEAADEMPKPVRKRLISRKELRDSEEKRRRASLVSVASSSSQEISKQRDSPNSQIKKVNRDSSREPPRTSNLESIKKRPRPSASPSDGNSPTLRRSPDLKKTKRIRAEADSKSLKMNEIDRENLKRDSPQPSLERSSSFKSAPVAFMGGSSAQSKESKSKPSETNKDPAKTESGKQTSSNSSPESSSSSKEIKRERDIDDKEQSETSKQLQSETQAAAAAEQEEKRLRERARQQERERKEKEQRQKELLEQKEKEKAALEKAALEKAALEKAALEKAALEKAALEKAALEKAALEKAALEEANRKEIARQEAQRLAEEAERKAKIEREEQEAKEKKARAEEAARQMAEKERKRKEEEENQARRRAEQEEKERLAEIKRREEDERRRREALPNGLRLIAEMGPEEAKKEAQIKSWLPLYTLTSTEIGANTTSGDERWILNIQAASLLGSSDLELSQYTAWNKQTADQEERYAMWRVLRNKLTCYQPEPFSTPDHEAAFALDQETMQKYFAIENMFWIRFSDYMDTALSYAHLHSFREQIEKTGACSVTRFYTDKPGIRPDKDCARPREADPSFRGHLRNGFH